MRQNVMTYSKHVYPRKASHVALTEEATCALYLLSGYPVAHTFVQHIVWSEI